MLFLALFLFRWKKKEWFLQQTFWCTLLGWVWRRKCRARFKLSTLSGIKSHTSCIGFIDSTSSNFFRGASFPSSKLVKLPWSDTFDERYKKVILYLYFCVLFSSLAISHHHHFFSSCGSFLYWILEYENIKNNMKALALNLLAWYLTRNKNKDDNTFKIFL